MLEVGKTFGMMKALHEAGADGIFLKMTAGGKDFTMIMQLLTIKEGSFPSSLFLIPPGYTQSDEGMVGHLLPAGKKP
jgi:hypothetical protein